MRKSRLSKAKQKVKIRHIKQLVKECFTGLSGAAPNINEEVERGVFSQARRRMYAFVQEAGYFGILPPHCQDDPVI